MFSYFTSIFETKGISAISFIFKSIFLLKGHYAWINETFIRAIMSFNALIKNENKFRCQRMKCAFFVFVVVKCGNSPEFFFF